MRLKTILLAFTLTFVCAQAPANEIDDIKKKINDITDAINKDADFYERVYPKNVDLIVRYRVGWGWLVEISDVSYSLDVLDEEVGRLHSLVGYLGEIDSDGVSSDIPPDYQLVKDEIARVNDNLISLADTLAGTALQCDTVAGQRVLSSVPLNSIISIQGPDLGTVPTLHHHPTLYLKFEIDDGGNVSFVPDTTVATNAKGKYAIPGIAGTVSGAIVQWAATLHGGAAAAASFTTALAATAAAALVYVTVDHVINELDQGQLADAVSALNKAIDRVNTAQRVAYQNVDKNYKDIISSSCRENFTVAYKAQQERLGQLNDQRQKEFDAFVREKSRIEGIKRPHPSWNEAECAIFGCNGTSEPTAVMSLDELVDLFSTLRQR